MSYDLSSCIQEILLFQSVAELDPAIHRFAKEMDPRVKPTG